MARDRSLDVAVTGLSARFPGPSSIEAWWSAIRAGQVLTTRYDVDYLRDAGIPPELFNDPDYVPVRGHLAGGDCFDNEFFRISPRDAEMLDPQHRLMLEAAWSAMEDAGTAFGTQRPVTGVYASTSGSEYLRSMLVGGPLDPATLDQALHGTEPDFIASLIAYKLDLSGPAMSVQTACSSSLVGVHLAVQALLNGDCDQALVVSAGMAFPQGGHLHVPGGIKSASGQCRPFSESADGVVEGSGAACIVLRRLADALADGPEPYAVILGTAINNDGSAKAGYYAPSARGQKAVILAALKGADVDACSIGYLEAHGTGTPIGDPIEWSAASAAFAEAGAPPEQIAVGALKANIGHLDAAAGLAGLIKAMYVLRDGVVPPVAGFERPNALLEIENSPLFVPTELLPWMGPQPRRACISAFGIGGTNAHMIIEQAARRRPQRRRTPHPRLLALSANDAKALSRAAARLADHLSAEDPDLADVSFTLASGRAAFSERLAVAGTQCADLARLLASPEELPRGRVPEGAIRPLAFLLPGQGVQWPGMARPAAAALPGFASALDDCLGAFEPRHASRLRDALLEPSFPEHELEETVLAQPAIFAMEYALATTLMALGITPSVVAGHSLGEITAACVAGIIELSDAARFVTARGRSMQACAAGAMLALGCSEARARDLVRRSELGVEIAAINTSGNCVVGGTVEAIDAFESGLGAGIWSQRLRTRRAFHSRLIEPALAELESELARLRIRPSRLPLASGATGEIVPAGTLLSSRFFLDQSRQPVRFADALAAAIRHFSSAVSLEVGPGQALASMARTVGLRTFSLSGGAGRDGAQILKALGALWVEGHPVDLVGLCREGAPVHLPAYPFAGPAHIAPEARRDRLPPRRGPAVDKSIPLTDARHEAAYVRAIADDASAKDASGVVTEVWRELLGHTDLTEHSDFFDLGGDSLLITSIIHRLKRTLAIDIPPRAMLAARTLGQQSGIVSALLNRAGQSASRRNGSAGVAGS
jgi:phthiocerol/phenolphthiocerol synthesis type-I polyketide synthase E